MKPSVDHNAELVPFEVAPGENDQEMSCGAIECEISKVWATVFHVQKVGADENFFELGGDSLTGLKLTEALADTLGLQLPVVQIFLNPTIRELALHVAQNVPSGTEL